MIKRNDIKDTSPLSLKNLNDTLRGLVYKLGGNIEYLDLGDDMRKKWDSIVTDGNLQSKIEQNPEWIRISFNGNSTYVEFANDNNMYFRQADGSYFKAGLAGIQKHTASGDRDVHYLSYVGSATVSQGNSVTVTLPTDFRNKDFKITVSASSVDAGEGTHGSLMLSYFNCYVTAINNVAGTFTIDGYMISQGYYLSPSLAYVTEANAFVLTENTALLPEFGFDTSITVSYTVIA